MVRRAYLAGRWYPGSAAECKAAMEAHAGDTSPLQGDWRAVIVPHAGWYFSGAAMGRAYRWLAEANPDIDLVVVFGSHRGPQGPNTILCASGWETPLGELPVAVPLAEKLRSQLNLTDEPECPRNPDNAAEVQMPWVRQFFPRAELLMLGVAASQIATDIGRAVGEACLTEGRKTVFIGSTDLTHYGPNYGFSPEGDGEGAVRWVREVNDRGFLDAVLDEDSTSALEHARINQSACCPGAVLSAMSAARVEDMPTSPTLIDHYLSCDVMPGHSFVGYGAVVL